MIIKQRQIFIDINKNTTKNVSHRCTKLVALWNAYTLKNAQNAYEAQNAWNADDF